MRIRELEHREQIRDLVIRYGFAVDERDFPALRAMFTDDAVLRTMSGRAKGVGVDNVVRYFEEHLPSIGPSNHFVHGQTVELDRQDEDHATGLVSSHAELWRDGAPMLTAMRYHDTYRRVDEHWRFQERVQAYMYFVDVREYASVLGERLRVRASKESPQAADWPKAFT
jgi:ketosteroid isomerase-like protein